eukprot:5841920-Pyramimonas_sp.AAC.2
MSRIPHFPPFRLRKQTQTLSSARSAASRCLLEALIGPVEQLSAPGITDGRGKVLAGSIWPRAIPR